MYFASSFYMFDHVQYHIIWIANATSTHYYYIDDYPIITALARYASLLMSQDWAHLEGVRLRALLQHLLRLTAKTAESRTLLCGKGGCFTRSGITWIMEAGQFPGFMITCLYNSLIQKPCHQRSFFCGLRDSNANGLKQHPHLTASGYMGTSGCGRQD